MLKIDSISCSYGRLSVLHELSMEVGAESVGLFGPNGAGKTTLVNAIFGMVPVRSGTITLDGQDITGKPTHEIVRSGVALVPQARELFPFMTVSENLMVAAEQVPHARDCSAETLEEVVTIFPILAERSRQLAVTLSGGQQRMLAVGRALMAKPRVLILDEPSLGLQPSIVHELFSILSEMKKEISILVAEQNVRESLRSVDRGYVLENGRIVVTGTAAELAHDPEVERSYLGL